MNEAAALLSWYRRSRRDLPWRRTRDPWAIWVSEVMLQQTRVEHVIAFFEPFLERFPSVAALAEAPLEEALAAWSGLGYYRRLRLLHRAAKQVMASGGTIPSTEEQLRCLPGVGDYTAAAVSSIAFGACTPVLDGNVIRVLTRRLACAEDPARPAVRRRLRAVAAELLDADAAGDSNQALMELGATVCTPVVPRCGECPLSPGCAARANGIPEAFPQRAGKPRPRLVPLVVAVIERGDRVLLFRRDDDEVLLAGTWELPWVQDGNGDGGDAASALGARYGGRFTLGAEVGRVRHAITTRRIVASVRRAGFSARDDEVREGREAAWVRRAEVATLPTSSLVRKALALAP
ncbi:MAG TPA: A/G-specific adenine glycosylase [Thermoanaerobaculia bacterium]|nr:A/G-specific adenine glycosylase [Thermoanaerobaculia bacterium]